MRNWPTVHGSMSFVPRRVINLAIRWFGGADSYRIIYVIYILCGVWVIRRKYIEKNKYVFVTFRIVQVLAFLACIFSLISFSYDAYLMRHSVEKLSYNLGTTMFFIIALARFLFLSIKKDSFEEMLNVINHNMFVDGVGTKPRDLSILNEGEREFKRISNFFYWMVIFGMTSKILCHVVSEKSLPIPFPYIEKIDSPYYEIMFAGEGVAFFHFVFTVATQEMVTFGVLIRITRHFTILSRNILDVMHVYTTPETHKLDDVLVRKPLQLKEDPKWREEKTFFMLKRNVIHHQEIMKVMRKTGHILRESLFIQIFGGALLLVDLLFHLSMQNTNSALMIVCQFIYTGSAMLDVIIMCYYGSEIQTMSHDAAKALYFIPWLQMDKRNRKILRFFQMALWKHPTIKAGYIFSVNLNMYIKFINTIYSYLAFMQKTFNRGGSGDGSKL